MKDHYQLSLSIINRLVRKSIYNQAEVIAIYTEKNNEVNTSFMLKHHILSEGKELILIDDTLKDIEADIYIIPAEKFSEDGNIISRVDLGQKSNIFALSFESNKVEHIVNDSKAKVLTEKAGYNV